MIVLDTNVVSESVKPLPAAGVLAWVDDHFDVLGVTSITVGELLVGVQIMPAGHRRDQLAEALETSFLRLMPCLDYDEAAARAYAKMREIAQRVGRGLSPEDGMIAAICVARGATLATRNVKDFDFLPVDIVNPWELAGT